MQVEGKKVIWLGETPSTNMEAKRLASSGAPEWTVVAADSQTAGRGRLGRSWHSDGPWGLWASVILRPSGFPAEKLPLLGIMTAVAVAKSIRALTGLEAKVKWPNDVEVEGRKVCGVLPEASFSGGLLEWIVIGFGINMEEPPSAMPPEIKERAASIEGLCGLKIDRCVMLKAVMQELGSLYGSYLKQEMASIMSEIRKLSTLLGKAISVYSPQGSFDATAVDMDDFGALIVETEGGGTRRLLSGEVSVRRPT